jgi:FkbM family methyltransferase
MNVPVKFNDVNFMMSIPDIICGYYPGANVQLEIFKNGIWAREESIILTTILDKFKGLVIDVGANTGYFSFLALYKKCDVISIEPNTIHTKYFMETMELNKFSFEKLRHYELLVSSKIEDVSFDGWSATSGIMNVSDENLLVKTISLDNICDECLFLKIDVEGYEPEVINSADNLLKNKKISYIMFEITYIIDNKIDNNNINMIYKLNNYGYNLYEIQPNILITIDNIENKVKKWEYEYFNTHKKHDHLITCAGSNLLAIHKDQLNPFTPLIGTNNFII